MKFDVVECLITLNQKNNTNLMQIMLTGPDAVRVTEIPILQYLNETPQDDDSGVHLPCCISRAKTVRQEDATSQDEVMRLSMKYGSAVFKAVYGQARPAFPKTLDDVELPAEAFAEKPKRQITIAQARKELTEMGIDIPKGKLSLDDLLTFYPED